MSCKMCYAYDEGMMWDEVAGVMISCDECAFYDL